MSHICRGMQANNKSSIINRTQILLSVCKYLWNLSDGRFIWFKRLHSAIVPASKPLYNNPDETTFVTFRQPYNNQLALND